MTSRERVMASFGGKRPDRVPLNVFAGWNPGIRAQVNDRYGDVDGFAGRHHLDIVTGVLPRFPFGGRELQGQIRDLDQYLDLDPIDPRSGRLLEQAADENQHADADQAMDLFLSVRDALTYHRNELAVFVHAWGVFELSQFLFEKDGRPGTEQALLNMLAEKEKTAEIYGKLATWSAACIENAIEAGADVVELSDDWGQQNTMLFSPDLWWELVFPATKTIVDAAHRHGVPVLLHSDGDISRVLDGIRGLGVSGLHPVQESAGMSFSRTRDVLGPGVCIMGGLDTVTALPNMTETTVRAEVKRVFDELKPSGPFIFAGSHMFQDDAPLDVIDAAYDAAYELAAY